MVAFGSRRLPLLIALLVLGSLCAPLGARAFASAPAFSVSPTSAVFGAQAVGTTSAAQTFTVTNTGDADLIIATASMAAGASQYIIGTNSCTGATVAPTGTCTVAVSFKPTSTGTQPGILRFTHNASGSPNDVSLTGTGTSPIVSVSPTSADYGSQTVGTTSAAQTFTVTNTGNADLTISSASLTGTNSDQYVEGTDTCSGATVAPSGTCTVDVYFSPTSTGTKAAVLRFAHNAPGAPKDVSLIGSGDPAPGFSASPSSKDYGDQVTGTVSLGQTLTVTNTGDADLNITTASLIGTDASQFTTTADGCTGATVIPSSTCTVTVAFAPTSIGTKTATLRFTDNTPGSPHDVALTGTGSTPPPEVTCHGLVATIVGTSGSDTLVGTAGPDVLVALGGDDTIKGLAGNDVICGDGGEDQIVGGTGRDSIDGAGGADALRGGGGSDTLVGGKGNDLVLGDSGADWINGSAGNDRLFGGSGRDHIVGGPGHDTIRP